jgi:hypothetical protein
MVLPPQGRAIVPAEQVLAPRPAAPAAPTVPVGRLMTFAGPRVRVAPTRTGAPQVRSHSVPRSDQVAALRRILGSASAARTAVLAAEVLGPPRALQEHGLER